MALTKDQFRRISVLHTALLSYKAYRFEELLQRVNDSIDKPISRRTLFLDLALLRELGAPLDKPSRTAPYRYTESFSLFDVFNPTEAELLKTAIDVLRRLSGLSVVETFVPELTQLLLRLRSEEAGLKKVVFFDQHQGYQGLAFLEQLYNYIQAEQVILLHYKSFDGVRYEGHLHPYLLKEYRGRWYVYGLDHVLQQVHRFPLDRIRHVEPCTELAFIPNTTWDADKHFAEMVGISRQEGQLPERIRLRSFGTTSDYLLTKPLHHSQQLVEEAEAYCEFEYQVIRNYEFEALLRSFGEGVIEIK